MTEEASNEISTPLLVLIVGAAAVVMALLVWALTRGTLEWPLGAVYLRLMAVALVGSVLGVASLNPKLIGRRAWPGPGTKRWDWIVLAFLMPSMFGVFVVAGVDGGDWVADGPTGSWWLGSVAFALGWILITWSMIVNPFFEKTVRIQTDHGHHVIDSGPYSFIRHPGYTGFSFWLLSTPLLLASSLSWIPAGVAVGVFVFRTVLEDRTLERELPGYVEYMGRTRFRLIPGVW